MYNLTDQPWINVLHHDGRPVRLSLADTLRSAHSLHLAYSNPMDRLATFRFLLALGYWCFANTGQAPESGQALPPAWLGWLEENREYFELFGEGRRFYQSPGSARTRPSTDLIHELPAANNFWHFRHVTDYIDGLCPACCVSGLLRLPVFTTIGGAGLGAGLNQTPPVYAIWQGTSLAETLGLNWQAANEPGLPAWLDPFLAQTEQEVGLLAGLTWLPRKVLLHGPEPGPARCSACGETAEALVYSCNNEAVNVPRTAVWHDPHAIYREDGNGLTAKVGLMSGDKYTFADRDWHKPLVQAIRTSQPPGPSRLFMVGFSSVQAKCVDVWEKTIALSGEAYDEELLAQIEARAYSLNKMRKQARRGSYQRSVGITAVADIIPHVEHRVGAHAGELIENKGHTWQEADRDYRFFMERLAISLEPEITAGAKLKREQLAHRKPWPLKPKATSKPKAKPKAGGDNE